MCTGPGQALITKGQHKLTVEIVGINEKAVKKHMFGLDYILLKPQKKPAARQRRCENRN
jgi:hypothetical protein